MLPSRLFIKLLSSFILPIFLAIGFVNVFVYYQNKKEIYATHTDYLQSYAHLLASQGLKLFINTAQIKQYDKGLRITLINVNGAVIADNQLDAKRLTNHRDRPEVLASLAIGSGSAIRTSESTGERMLYFAELVGTIREPLGIVRISVPVKKLDAKLAALQEKILAISGLGLLLAILFGTVVVHRRSQAIQEMSAATEQMQRGQFKLQIKNLPNDEVGKLGELINHLGTELSKRISVIAEERAQLQAILASMIEGVIAVDADNRLLFSNSAASRLLMLNNPLLPRLPLTDQVSISEMFEVLETVKQSQQPLLRELDIFHPDKKMLMSVTATPLDLQRDDRRPGVLLVFHDVSDVRRLEKIRQDFVANASHELKTPLTVVKGYVDTLLDGAAEDGAIREKFLRQIATNVDHLVTLLNDLLTLSRLDAKQQPLPLGFIDISERVRINIARLLPNAEKKGVTVVIEGTTEPLNVVSNAHALDVILFNLLDNAIKYTDAPGTIRVAIQKTANDVELVVADNGIGIPAEDLPRIFERFYRVDKARSGNTEGTGLGLAIVKHLTHEIRASINVESQRGIGTIFTLHLPLKDNKSR